MVSLHSIQVLTKKDVGSQEQGIAVRDLSILFIDGMWSLGFRIRKAVEHFKLDLMG